MSSIPKIGAKRKAPNDGKGRPKGAVNKTTAAVKDMVREALERAGGVEYLARQAIENPKAFLALAGKLIPLEVSAQVGVGSLEELVAKSLEAK